MKKNMELINAMFIILTLLTVFFGSILVTYRIFDPLKYSYLLYVVLFISIILIILNKINIKKYILVILLIVFGLISCLLSGDIKTCLIGFQYRNEGYIVILCYLCLFIVASLIKNNKYKEIIINAILILGMINIAYGCLEALKIIKTNSQYPMAFTGNSNSFGALCTMYSGLSLGLYIFSKNKFYIIYLLISILGLIISGCMSAYVALIGVLLFIIIYLIYLKKTNVNISNYIKKIGIFFVCILFIYSIAVYNKSTINRDVIKMFNEVKDILKGNISYNFGTNRIEIWSKTMEVAPNYLIHGIGIDRFAYAMDNLYFITSKGTYVDKAHNEYLQILITQGIFALITYLLFLATIIKSCIKNMKNNYIFIALFLAITGYLIQAFFNISITRVSPILYIIMGLAYTNTIDKYKKKN